MRTELIIPMGFENSSERAECSRIQDKSLRCIAKRPLASFVYFQSSLLTTVVVLKNNLIATVTV